jgi:hypothetical protein
LNELFGEPEAVLRLDFTEVGKLANADPEAVKEGLREEGYYLQLPPKHPVEEEISRLFS